MADAANDPRRRALAVGVAALAVAAGTAVAVSGLARRWFGAPAAARYHGRDVTSDGWGGPFTLTDAQGRQRSLSDFQGKAVLLSFGYTHCPDVCPTTLAKFAQARHLLAGDAARVQGIFVTIDPERDTAALLAAYVPTFDPTFVALRGSEAQTDTVTRAYHANYQIIETRGSVLVDHTAWTYLIGPDGRTRVVTPYDQSARELADDIALVLAGG